MVVVLVSLFVFRGNPTIAGQTDGLLKAMEAVGFAPVARTGEIQFWGTEIDLQTGIPWPIPRFADNEDGTVTDNLTGIVWLKDAYHFGPKNWIQAVDSCNSLEDNGIDLTDGSVQGDWRLPSIKELLSLIDYRFRNPVLPNTIGDGQWTEGDPFSNVQVTGRYWSSTICERGGGTPLKRYISFSEGFTYERNWETPRHVWCVRGSN
jgi:hypothetical protein